MQPLSVIITTHNESEHIGPLLAHLDWVSDILVVDSFSNDDTVAQAQAAGARVVQRQYTGPADQKNWAIPQAKHPWILLLDADERVPDALKEEIINWLKQPEIPYDCFWIKRRNFFMGQEIKYSGWQGDAVVRFFRRAVCRYNDLQVHEEIETTGLRVATLKNKMLHYTFKDATHFLDKTRRYARWSAQDYVARTGQVKWFHLFGKPAFRFFKHFLLKGGFRDGKVGLVVSVLMAWGVFLRYLYIFEGQRQNKKRSNDQS